MENPERTTESAGQFKGVKGWLLFLCVSLTILGPIHTVIELIKEWHETSPLFGRFPSFQTAVMVETAATMAVTCFGIYAGYALWTVRPDAPRIAKNYFLTRLAYVVVLPFFIIAISNLPPAANTAITQEGIKQAIRGILIFAIWFTYLKRSKRVRETYPIRSAPETQPDRPKAEGL